MDYKLIPLSRGLSVKVSPEHYEWLNQWKWYAVSGNKGFYAVRTVYVPKKHSIKMHRLVTGAQENQEVDHWNHDTLDNRGENLRVANKTLNLGNMMNSQGGTSIFKGVSWHPINNNWMARIRNQHLGSFRDEREAALQYDRAALEVYGEFAFLNFPDEVGTTKLRPLSRPIEATKTRPRSVRKAA